VSAARRGWTRRVRAAIVTAGMLAACAGAARAEGGAAGTTGAAFLQVGTGADVLSRGGATLALGGDLAVVPWNPAALGWMDGTQLALAHATLADEARQEWVAIGGRIGRSALRWSLDGLYQDEGTFEGRDAAGAETGDFGVSSTALALHVARPLTPLLSVGVGARYIGERLGTTSGTGYSLDAGVQLRAGPLGAGVALTNAGGSITYGGTRCDPPTSLGIGAAVTLPGTGLTLLADADFPRAYYDDVRVGAEWRWHGLLALRAGYRRELSAPDEVAENGPSFGIGAGARGLRLDYGYLVPGTGEGQHRLSVALRPGSLVAMDPFGR
jgi:hypothetical protein